MIEKEEVNIEEIYLAEEKIVAFLEELETYESIEEIIIIEKRNNYLKCENKEVRIYKNLVNEQLLYIDEKENNLIEKDNEYILEHQIENKISLKEIMNKLEILQNIDPRYKSVIYSSYKKIKKAKGKITKSDFNQIKDDIINMYLYNIICQTEEEKEETKIYEFNKYKVRSKKDK